MIVEHTRYKIANEKRKEFENAYTKLNVHLKNPLTTSNMSDDITAEIINYLHGMKQDELSYSYR